MVAERRVLRRIEHLEHRARRVAAVVRAHLVDLVDEDDRVARLGVAERADDRPGHGADVRAPVAADLRLVADAAHGQAHELPPERARDRLAERRLADAGRAGEAQDRPRHVALELPDGEELDDPLLHLLEVEVVLVEDLARAAQVEVVVGEGVPRERGDPVEVGADDPVLRGRGRQPLQPAQLPVDRAAHLLRELDALEARPQLVQLGVLRVGLAQLLLDRLQLLPEVELALPLLELGLHLRLDLRPELEHLQLAVQDQRGLPQPRLDVGQLEEHLLLLGLEPHRRRDQVAQRARVVDRRGGQLQLLGQVRQQPDDPREERLDVPRERLDLA